jgi:phage terminase Nu1 subunit (DNA packaging protein)
MSKTDYPISLQALAELFEVTPRRINQLENDGTVVKIERGKYALLKSVKGYLAAKERELAELRAGSEVIRKAEEDRAVAQARLIELTLAEKESQVISIRDVELVIEPAIAAVVKILEGIPKHAARELGNRDVEQFLEKHINDARTELASVPDRLKRLGPAPERDAAPDVLPVSSTAKADGKPVGGSVPVSQRRRRRAR